MKGKFIFAFYYAYRVAVGGGERVRTDGLLRAKQALSQLSYTPEYLLDNRGGPRKT